MTACDDLRLGGSLSGAGITGGTTINGTRFAVDDWSGVFGHGGISFTPVEVSGRAGGFLVGDGLALARYPNLNMRIKSQLECDSLEIPAEVLQENTDDFLALLADPAGQYLEVDLPDATSRFLHVHANIAAPLAQPAEIRRIIVPMYSSNPYWRAGGAQSTDTISGADTLAVGGNVNVYDAVLVFAGNGTLTHADWELEVSGASGPVTVDLGARTVKEGGVDADQWLRPSSRFWAWFTPGNNALTSDVSVGVTWRNQFN